MICEPRGVFGCGEASPPSPQMQKGRVWCRNQPDSGNGDSCLGALCAKGGTCDSILPFRNRQPLPTVCGIEVQRALAPGRSSHEDEEGHEGGLVLWLAEKHCISREREKRERELRPRGRKELASLGHWAFARAGT